MILDENGEEQELILIRKPEENPEEANERMLEKIEKTLINYPDALTYREHKFMGSGDPIQEQLEFFRKRREGKRLGIGIDEREYWQREKDKFL